ncbi:DinB family protein [Rasiella rasia]|uniref:DinB family protein n=1 Tax=Rasiella rasia TaxID=2744027 RepID=A0A6G6GNH9_9FLAO|nr:DinB family protein [Rasiella rasia]QIE60050.1 DinB family protein [Rasiella rasia]
MKFTLDITLKTRKIFFHFLETLSLEQLNKIPDGFNNNVFWNIKHCVVVQQMLVYGLSSLPLHVSSEEVMRYKKGTKPEGLVAQEEVDLCKKQLFDLLKQTETDANNQLFKTYKEYTVTTKTTLTSTQEAIEFNNFHEGVHLGYVMALLKNV